MGLSIGNGILSNGKMIINNVCIFYIDFEGCIWVIEKNMNVVFIIGSGIIVVIGVMDNFVLMKIDGIGVISNVSLVIGDVGKNNIKLGDIYIQVIVDLDGDIIFDEK